MPNDACVDRFSEIKAEVRVPYSDMGGPSLEKSRLAADPIGAEHCASLGKTAVFVSGRREVGTIATDVYTGEYVFLYRCEDDRTSPRAAPTGS